MTERSSRVFRPWKLLLSGFVASGLVLGGTTAASANEGDELSPAGTPIIQAEGTPDAALVAQVEAQMTPLMEATTNDGVSTFNADQALANGAAPQDVADFSAMLGAAGGVVEGSAGVPASAEATTMAQTLAACAGRQGFTGVFPSGPQWALNSCETGKLISAVGLGAAGATAVGVVLALAGAPQGGAVAGVIAAIIGLGAAFLVVCESWSSNSAIYLNGGVPGIVPPSCWGQ